MQGDGWVTDYKPWGRLGHREAWRTHANRHPPVEPALHHRCSPTVAGEGWGTRPCDPAAAAGLGRPPDCVLAQGIPHLASPPHHGEVTRPWAAVGVFWHPFHSMPYDHGYAVNRPRGVTPRGKM